MNLAALAPLAGVVKGIGAADEIQNRQREQDRLQALLALAQQRGAEENRLFQQQQSAGALAGQALPGASAPLPMPQQTPMQPLSLQPQGGPQQQRAQAMPQQASLRAPSEAGDVPFPTRQNNVRDASATPLSFVDQPGGKPYQAQVSDGQFRVADQLIGQSAFAQAQSNIPIPAVKSAADTSRAAVKEFDPMEYGQLRSQQIVDAVDKAGPNADPIVKFLAVAQLQKLMLPEDRLAMAAWQRQNQDQIRVGIAELRAQTQKDIAADRPGRSLGTPSIVQTDQGPMVFDPSTRTASPLTGPGGQPITGTVSKPGTRSSTTPISQSEVAFWGNVMKQGGSLPSYIGRNRDLAAAIMKDVGESGADPGEFISRQATKKADASSLTAATRMSDAAIGFEETALKNLEVATKALHGVAPTDLGPFINKWIESGETFAGDPKVPASITAVITFANEYAKVMSGSTGAQGATVDARREAAERFNPYFSAGQWDEVAKIAKTDMANRKAALTENIDRIKGRIVGGGAPAGDKLQGAPQGTNLDVSEDAYNKLPPGSIYTIPGDPTPRVKP